MQTIIEAEEKPLGVIESLQQGFNFLNHHLWLLVLPILLDLFLWLGPRLSIAALVDRVVTFAVTSQPELPADIAENFDLAVENLRSLGGNSNLFALLAGLLTGMPSLFARLDFRSVSALHGRVIEITTWRSAAAWAAFLIPVGVLIGSFWLSLLVFALRRERFPSSRFISRWGWLWLNINLYLLALAAAIIFASLLFGMVGAILMMTLGSIGTALFGLLWILFIGFSIWLSIGLYFVVIAVALDGVNLASAVWRSLNVVGRNAMSTLGLLILILLLTEGFARIWMQLSGQTWGVFLGILGNAYLGSALLAAACLFYQSRYVHWQKTRTLVMLGQSAEQNDKS